MTIRTQAFDTARHLDNPEIIAWYLADAIQTGDNKVILNAIRNVVRAGNISRIARETGLSRTSLYWGKNTSPEFTTVLKVLAARGVGLVPKVQTRAKTVRPRKHLAREEVVVIASSKLGATSPQVHPAMHGMKASAKSHLARKKK
jgi:probable addiction module antidote protein